MAEEPLSFNQLVHAVTEFIEVAIHTILYVRQIYPAEIFVRRKKYDTPVFQSRHPALNEYISGAVKAIGDELVYGKVDKVVIVIKDKQEVALERFIISVDYMIDVKALSKDISVEDAVTASSLTQSFRSFMVKLGMIESQIGQMHLGDDVSFTVVIELKDDEAPVHSDTKDDPPKWISAVTQHTTAGAEKKARLHLVRAVNTGIINLSLGVQESAEKIKRDEENRQRKKKPPPKEKQRDPAAPSAVPVQEVPSEPVPIPVGGDEPKVAPTAPPEAENNAEKENKITETVAAVEPLPEPDSH